MTLCGNGAMVLYYDIAPGFTDDHDDWHTHEHFPERLSIPGFLRATRWINTAGNPRYLVLYEVSDVPVLSGAPYLERLNNPTPWTTRMMVNFRGMTRGFCRLVSSSGAGLGHALLSIRYVPAPGRESELRAWLKTQVLPGISGKPGTVSACLLEPAARPPMTKEQGIRGTDAELPCVLLVTGYAADALSRIGADELSTEKFERHGAAAVAARGSYRLDLLLSDADKHGSP
jgi:hypothetical protein